MKVLTIIAVIFLLVENYKFGTANKHEKKTKTVGFLLFEGIQPLDLIGPWEVFWTLGMIRKNSVKCIKFGETMDPVTSHNMISFSPQYDFNNLPHIDILIVPGASNISIALESSVLIKKVASIARSAEKVISICSGAFILQAAGLLEGKRTTTHWRTINEMKDLGVKTIGKRVVEDGTFWSSGGITSGIDMALSFIADTWGRKAAGQVQLILEYFPPHKSYARKGEEKYLRPYWALTRNTGKVDQSPLPEYIVNDYFRGSYGHNHRYKYLRPYWDLSRNRGRYGHNHRYR